jgi:hypothetical protein
VYVDTWYHGLGDQLERLLLGMSVSYLHKYSQITLVVDDKFGTVSQHLKGGYEEIFRLLGLPTYRFLQLSTVNRHFKPVRRLVLNNYRAILDKAPTLIKCGEMHEIDIYDSCIGWCPYFFIGETQKILKPLLRSAYKNESKCLNHKFKKIIHVNESSLTISFSANLKISNEEIPRINTAVHEGSLSNFSPINPEKLNIVWHVRSGDICLHCSTNGKFMYMCIYNYIVYVSTH